ncbi:cysteine desulfurase family protein [Paenibacillus thermoaerophilus]|uniref:Cysteine desulfurase family protein n=1 Tax=Paenibacillus thermoaerophilus TaxID=1215385 RepID=A0ABW2UYX3_9BACL|nr:cysteine desulfurase family protein [Paenibacillus thermoaerophilus]TMV17330.1 cysteine desulfurase [Paenibacillus thermoaerophilus]
MERTSIYLDHAASTPLAPGVLEAMLPYWSQAYGNPSSLHRYGQAARVAVSRARDEAASRLGVSPAELIYTSGGTESDNLAILGAADARPKERRHAVTTAIEHHAVLHAFRRLEREGVEVTYVRPDSTGQVSPEAIREAVRPDTFLISVMYGNNEVGTIQPVSEIGEIARSVGALYHVDAVQALGAVPIDLKAIGADFVSFSAHKIGGPKGVGLLYARRGAALEPQLWGGLQERGRRAGTENVPGIVGMTAALGLALDNLPERMAKLEALRSELLARLAEVAGSDGMVVNGHPVDRLPHILNVSFPGLSTETLLMNLDLAGVCAASGSACSSGSLELSHVLRAMDLPEDRMRSAVRFSVGMSNTLEEMAEAARRFETFYRKIRK